MRILAIALAVCVPGLAHAGSPADYAWRWPLETKGNGAAWQFEPDAAVLAALQDPNFGDLQVFDATGKPMPTGRMAANRGAGPAGHWLPARFASSGPAEGVAGDAGVMSYTYRLPAALPALGLRFDRDALPTTVAVLYRQDGQWRLAAKVAPPRPEPAMDAATVSTPPADGIPFAAPIVAEAWRINSGVALAPAPRLELEVGQPRFAFVAEGTPPYVLAVGHPVLRRQQRPLDPKLARWISGDPPLAPLGAPTQAPFVPIAQPVDAGAAWMRWWPWLAVAAGLMVALLLLRRRGPAARRG